MKIKISGLFKALAFVAITAFLYTGCKKKEDDKPTDYSASTDNSNANNAFAGIWKEISVVTDSSGTLRAPASSCATATISPFDLTTWPKTVVIDFGTTNCTGSDGNNRRGVITAVFSGPYQDSNTVITVTLTNYYHNNYRIQGTQTIRNNGHNSAGHLVYNVIVNGATVTSPDGTQTSTWSTNQNREFYAGYGTNLYIYDDVYLITGSANGTSATGESYTIVVNTALTVKIGCPWVVSGNFTLTLASWPTYPISFDYGVGACDAAATAVLNGTTYNIVMN
jgi:archaellum component FlaF (FlaF/FlaG flagellin family)